MSLLTLAPSVPIRIMGLRRLFSRGTSMYIQSEPHMLQFTKSLLFGVAVILG